MFMKYSSHVALDILIRRIIYDYYTLLFLSSCVIPKLFPYDKFPLCMKLTKGKLIETLRRKDEGWTTYQVRKIAGISIRRVNQVYGQYTLTGEIPEIGKNNGRPIKPIEDWEVQMVKQSYEKYRVSASTLERLIERDYKKHISLSRVEADTLYFS